MPACGYCGNPHISTTAVRVLYPEDVNAESLPGCPECGVLTEGHYRPKKYSRDTRDRHPAATAQTKRDGKDTPTYRPRSEGGGDE